MRPTARIIRSRTGCFTCRRRKKKCNEEKPVCSGCKRNRLECHWPAELILPPGTHQRSGSAESVPLSPTVAMSVNEALSKYRKVQPKPEKVVTSVIPENIGGSSSQGPSQHDTGDMTRDNHAVSSELEEDLCLPSPSTLDDDMSVIQNFLSQQALSGIDEYSMFDQLHLGDMSTFSSHTNLEIPLSMSLLPSHDHNSFELLSYYLSRTANSMGNGSTEINPFIAKLVPLAFSHPLILQLILAQSAAHRQASGDRLFNNNEIAQRYYTASLRMFRHEVGEYVAGRDGNMLVLTVGSLILSLTEVARGDKCGTIFDHLTASKSLLAVLLNSAHAELSDDLPDFLVEYYMHMAACSMISTDAGGKSEQLLNPEIETLAMNLKSKNYVGQLCGSWFELLVLIPQIFQLGQRMLATADGDSISPSPDDIITFGLLQSQALTFSPSQTHHPDAHLAGLVFKQAVLLYLWSILGTPQTSAVNGSHKDLMESAVSEAVALLSQFPASARVNTSLCWPLSVIGCCTSDPAVQMILRTRLQTMIETIGLGNMRETLTLLEHVWMQPIDLTSPWTLCTLMQEHQTWISFA